MSPGRATPEPFVGTAPASTARLFPHLSGGTPLAEAFRPFLIGRLLEEGESLDLAWLTSVVSAEELREWVCTRGARQLSRRSLTFWTTVLEADAGPEPGDELWPR